MGLSLTNQHMKKINVIITGSTGMIGEAVLDQCLQHPQVEHILVLNRRVSGVQHPKLLEVVVSDLSQLSSIKDILPNYHACFFCIGVSSMGMDEATFTRMTYTLTMDFAKALVANNPDVTFCYISGAGTDSSETGKTMWARVKGKTENDLQKLGFSHVYNFRPGALIPYLAVKPTQTYQSVKYLKWLLVLLRPLFPNAILRLSDFAIAMINSALTGYSKAILEASDIKKLSELK
jgi:uncharacterized protein YbjT (DUF2867 family)